MWPQVEEANAKVAALARQGLAETAARMQEIAKAKKIVQAENVSMRTLRFRQKELVKELKQTQKWSSIMQGEFDKQGKVLKTKNDFNAVVNSGHVLGLELQKMHTQNLLARHSVESWESQVKEFDLRDEHEEKQKQVLFKKSAQMVSMKRKREGNIHKQYQVTNQRLQSTESHLAQQRRRLEDAEKMLARRQARVSAEEHGLKVLASRVRTVEERMRNQTQNAEKLNLEVATLQQNLKEDDSGIDAARAWLGSTHHLVKQRTEKAAQTALELIVPDSLKPHGDLVATMREAISLSMRAWGTNATNAAKVAAAASNEKAELGAVMEELRFKLNETRRKMSTFEREIDALHLSRGNLTHQLVEMESQDEKLKAEVTKLKRELMLEGSMTGKEIEDDIAMTREALRRLFAKAAKQSLRKRNVVGELGQSVDRLRGIRNFLHREQKVHSDLEKRLNSTTKELERNEAAYHKLSNDAEAEQQALDDELAQYSNVSKTLADAEVHIRLYHKLDQNSSVAFYHAADLLEKALDEQAASNALKEKQLINVSLQDNASLVHAANVSADITRREKHVAELKAKIDDEERRIHAEKRDVDQRRSELVRAVVSEVPEKQNAAERASQAYYAAEADVAEAKKEEMHTRTAEEQRLRTLKATRQMLAEHLHRAQMIEKQGIMRFNALQKKRRVLLLRARKMLEEEKAAQVSRAQLTVQRQKVHAHAETLLKDIITVQQQLKTVKSLYDKAQAQYHAAARKAALQIRSLSDRKKKAEEVAAKLNDTVRGLESLISE